MSKPTTIRVACPACGHEQEFDAWQSINATAEPELKQRLLSGRLTTCQCAECGRAAQVAFAMLYHDMDKRLVIWFVPGEGPIDSLENAGMEAIDRMTDEGYTFRLVRTHNELVEKILIFDDELDDRVLELFKFAIWSSMDEAHRPAEGSMLYVGTSESKTGERIMELVLLAGETQTAFEVPWDDAFKPFESEVAPVIAEAAPASGPWPRIDQAFAQALLNG